MITVYLDIRDVDGVVHFVDEDAWDYEEALCGKPLPSMAIPSHTGDLPSTVCATCVEKAHGGVTNIQVPTDLYEAVATIVIELQQY